MNFRFSGIGGILPWLIALLLGVLNIGYFGKAMLSEKEMGSWTGPLMPGKVLTLPDISQARIIDGVVPAKAPEPIPEPEKVKVLEPTPEVVEPVALPVVEKKKEEIQTSSKEGHFMVQVGSFVLKMGLDSLMERLRAEGLDPKVETNEERVRLNNVQAGPYGSQEKALEFETILKAHGYEVQIEETWEGYILSLSKSLLLSFSIQDMEKAKSIGVEPLRMVKIEADLPVRKVLLGPFVTKNDARKMSERVARLGFSVPVIKSWDAQKQSLLEKGQEQTP